jgi:hypothetical protein
MEFFKFINSLLSNVERTLSILPYNIYEISSPKLAKIYPKFDPQYDFIDRYDIETGLYYGEDMCRIIIEYNSDDDSDWGDQENM